MENLFNEGKARKARVFFTAMLLAEVGIVTFIFFACTASQARITETVQHTGSETPHWSYDGKTGPEHWYALDPAYAVAKDGKAQSPIDIVTTALTTSAAVNKPVINYHETLFEVENNGHTIELLPLASGNSIVIDGETYALRQFHFHLPSEHLIDGKASPMELHLVHGNDAGNLTVIGLMINEGAQNVILAKLFENLPSKPNEGMEKPEVTVNLAGLFDTAGGAYRYDGSLTTPPRPARNLIPFAVVLFLPCSSPLSLLCCRLITYRRSTTLSTSALLFFHQALGK